MCVNFNKYDGDTEKEIIDEIEENKTPHLDSSLEKFAQIFEGFHIESDDDFDGFE